MTAHNRLAVIVLLGTTQTLGFLNRSGDSSGGRKDAPASLLVVYRTLPVQNAVHFLEIGVRHDGRAEIVRMA